MSLKSIDMQIAVQKSAETGMRQNQLLHKPVHDQTALADQLHSKAEIDRHRSSKMDPKSENGIRDSEHQSKNKQGRQGNKKKDSLSSNVESTPLHPFKGKHVDLSL